MSGERDGSEDRGFTIVDKRGEEAEETPGPEAEGGGGASEGPSTAEGVASSAEPGAGGAQAGGPSGDLPPVDFGTFVISLGTSALYHLGLVKDPRTGEPGEKNLPVARQTIDTIEMLQEKTRGNLSDDEANLLTNLLTELRMRYVEAGRDSSGSS